MDQAALEEYKLCVARQDAAQARMWPMASVLLIFSLGGLALLGREAADDWQAVTLVGIGGLVSVALLWLWRAIDWNETYWQDLVYARLWELEKRLGFLTNRAIHFLLLSASQLASDPDWQRLPADERAFIRDFRFGHTRPWRMRLLFNLIAVGGTLAWVGVFTMRLVEFLQARGDSIDGTMALGITSFIIAVVSLAVSLVAICVSIWLAWRASESLRKSTKVAALTTGQVLRSVHYSQRPDYDKIIEGGWPYWEFTLTANIIKPGGTIEMEAQQVASGPGPLYSPEATITDPLWVVVPPSGKSFKAKPKHQLLDEFRCHWRVKYPADFTDATSDEEGLYTVDCFIPEEVYGRLFSSFFVLA